MVRWAPMVIFPDPMPFGSERAFAHTEAHANAGIIYAYWFYDGDTCVVKVGRTVNWKMRERSIFNDILSRYDTLPRIFALKKVHDVTVSENALVDRMSADERFQLHRGLEWFRTSLSADVFEAVVRNHVHESGR